jgi:hypothetical protein
VESELWAERDVRKELVLLGVIQILGRAVADMRGLKDLSAVGVDLAASDKVL